MLSFGSSWLSMKWRKNAENEQGEKAGYFWRLISYESGYLRSLNFIPLLQVVITPSATEIKFRMKFRLTICQDSPRGGGGGTYRLKSSFTSSWQEEGNKSWHEQLTQNVHAGQSTFWTSLGIASLHQRDFMFRKLSSWKEKKHFIWVSMYLARKC